MAVGNIAIYLNGVRILKGTKFSSGRKFDNSKEDTFDGKELSQDLDPEITCKLSRNVSYEPSFERVLMKAISNNVNGIPLVVLDKVGQGTRKRTYTGCVIDSIDDDREPKKKGTEDFGFTAKALKEEWV